MKEQGNAWKRSRASIESCKVALRAWVPRVSESHECELRLEEHGDRLTLLQDDRPIAAFALKDDRWQLFSIRGDGTWAPYDDKNYLTLAIPMLLVEEDSDGAFWG